MINSQPRRSADTCCFFGAPPYTATDRNPNALPNLTASEWIWSPSSRVGAMMSAIGEPAFPTAFSVWQRASTVDGFGKVKGM